jgi:hypothetical protein
VDVACVYSLNSFSIVEVDGWVDVVDVMHVDSLNSFFFVGIDG